MNAQSDTRENVRIRWYYDADADSSVNCAPVTGTALRAVHAENSLRYIEHPMQR